MSSSAGMLSAPSVLLFLSFIIATLISSKDGASTCDSCSLSSPSGGSVPLSPCRFSDFWKNFFHVLFILSLSPIILPFSSLHRVVLGTNPFLKEFIFLYAHLQLLFWKSSSILTIELFKCSLFLFHFVGLPFRLLIYLLSRSCWSL